MNLFHKVKYYLLPDIKILFYIEFILDAERAIDLESDVPDNFDLMGNILTAMKKYKEALKYYAEAIELASSNSTWLIFTGIITLPGSLFNACS